MVQMHVMMAAKLTTLNPLASGLRYITLFREPIARFLSEFYETYDGWETTHRTPPEQRREDACARQLPNHTMWRRAHFGVDFTTKDEYDALFPYWIRCSKNMAANRQTRALSYNEYFVKDGRTAGNLTRRLCGDLPLASKDCPLRLAREALYQFSFFGLNEARCASEKLFEAQFGVRFAAAHAARGAGADVGEGARRFSAKLSFKQLRPEEQVLVRQLNSDDLQLYKEAEQVFNLRLRAYGIPRDVRCVSVAVAAAQTSGTMSSD